MGPEIFGLQRYKSFKPTNESMKKIKNLVFDFGGVLYNIDIQRTTFALNQLQIPVNYNLNQNDNIFFQLERGEIDSGAFLKELNDSSPLNPGILRVKEAFLKILVGMPLESYRFLRRLSRFYSCYLLSNTNEIHYQHFYKEITSSLSYRDFYSSFVKEYYSFKIGMRKPDIAIFNYLINDSGIKVEESLFIDDDRNNISSAEKLGFNCFNFAVDGVWSDLIAQYDLEI